MKAERLLRAMTEIDAQLIQAHDPALAEKAAKPRKHRPLRIVLIAAAVAALLVTAAMALSPSFRDMILTSLGFRAPYATEVLGSCEDQGITIEAQSALTDGRVTRLYFTVHDPSGVFFLEDTDNDLYMDFLAGEERVYGASGKMEQLSFDPETQTGLYIYTQGTYAESPAARFPTQARLTMSYLIPGRRSSGARFAGPMPFGRATLPAEMLESTWENGDRVLLPDQNPQLIDEACPEVYISSMGFAPDGFYHVRVHQEPHVVAAYSTDPDVLPVHIFADVFSLDPEPTHQQYHELATVQVSDGWDFRIPYLSVENYDRLGLLLVDADYSVSGGMIEGAWNLTVPIHPTESCDAVLEEPLSFLDSRGSTVLLTSVSASPFSVVAEFTNPKDQVWGGSLENQTPPCSLTLADGSIIAPQLFQDAWTGRSGWIMWEFAEPIDPSQVVSVTLNGNEIAFPAE